MFEGAVKMNTTKKKIFFGAGTAAGLVALLVLLWQFLLANNLIGAADKSVSFTRATYPNSFLLVILIPLVATAILFYGITRKK